MKLEFFRQIFGKFSNIKLMKIRGMRVDLFNADRRTDMTKLVVAFRNIVKVLKTRDSSFRV
jgi:hypothetical protein